MSDSSAIENICRALSSAGVGEAEKILSSQYPFEAVQKRSRQYTRNQQVRLFRRDGFIDRYSGDRLVFPGVLRLLSIIFPDKFPYHRNWKSDQTHSAFWELFPTVDHVTPIARGGLDEESNWVTASMMRNSAKSNWTLDQLGWELRPPGELSDWDGLKGWFIEYMAQNEQYQEDTYLASWHQALVSTL